MVPATFAMVRRSTRTPSGSPQFLADSPGRCDQLRAQLEQTDKAAALADLWPTQVRPLLLEAADMLTAAGSADGTTLVSTPGKLAALVGEADAALLLSGQRVEGPRPPRWRASDRSWGSRGSPGARSTGTSIARQYGHRGPHEIELSIPARPRIPAGSTISSLALAAVTGHDAARDADALLASQDAARAASWQRLADYDPRKAASVRKLITRWAPLARGREAARSEVVRSVWVARTWVRRAGELTGHGDDLFFLELPEVFELLRGERAVLEQVPGRRAVYESYRALPSYPALIRGRFDPVHWAADPNRRVDYYDAAPSPRRSRRGRARY